MIRRYSVSKNKKESEKQSLIVLFILFLIPGYMYFFSDRSMYFECMKETMVCTYSHSTEYDKTMRPVKTYNLSRNMYAKATKHSRYKRGFYYTVDMTGTNGFLFKIPHDFTNDSEARNEARKFNHFLSSSQKNYAYFKMPSEISPVKLLFLLNLFLVAVALFSFRKNIRSDSNGTVNHSEISDIDEEIRKNLKEEGLSDEEIEAFLKELNEETDRELTLSDPNDDVIQRSKNI